MSFVKFDGKYMSRAPIVCPRCKVDVTNGVGPSDLPHVTNILNLLPSSHVFRNSADWHDLFYHLGKTEGDRKVADDYFHLSMKIAIKKNVTWILRPWYRMQAYRNYVFVRKFGWIFFNYKGCQKFEETTKA